MRDYILESIFLDTLYWKDGIEHGVDKHIPNHILEKFADPHYRAELCYEIGCGEYEIAPPHTGYRKKDDGSERVFLINEPEDRILLSVIYKWLMKNESGMIHHSCKSYQSGIGVSKIVKDVASRISNTQRKSLPKVVGRKFDIQKYFESINRSSIHDVLSMVESDFGESSIIDLLRSYYDTDLYYDSRSKVLKSNYHGIKQGSAVSAWLANVILYPLDEILSKRGGLYVRYSDDILYIGEDYEEVTELINNCLAEFGLSLNENKIKDILSDEYFSFLGFDINGRSISLSNKWVKKFQKEVDRRTIKNVRLIKRVRDIRQKGGDNKDSDLNICLRSSIQSLSKFLYYGNGQYSWASSALATINCSNDIIQLNNYCLDAIRAVYTGHTNIGGLGKASHGIIQRGKGRHVRSNRIKTKNITTDDSDISQFEGFMSLQAAQKIISNKWLFRTVATDLIDHERHELYGKTDIEEPLLQVEMVSTMESIYENYLKSQPSQEGVERFYAFGIDEMTPQMLMSGGNRKDSLGELEYYLMNNVNFSILSEGEDIWYWQSSRFPQLVLLKKWFRV